MTTLAINKPMTFSEGNIGAMGVIASDIIYEGAMVGDNGAGYARPLAAGDRFLGHCIEKVDNSSGSAGDKTVQFYTGRYRQRVTFAVTITDVGQPVYASDDDVLTLVAPSNSYVGVVTKYISSTECEVEFRPGEVDEFGTNVSRVTKSANYTTLAADNGKIIYVDTDAVVITLIAASPGYTVTVVNAAAAGTALIEVSPDANDHIDGGCGLAAGADGKNLQNTKATARRGDYVKVVASDGATTDTSYNLVARRGTWAVEA